LFAGTSLLSFTGTVGGLSFSGATLTSNAPGTPGIGFLSIGSTSITSSNTAESFTLNGSTSNYTQPGPNVSYVAGTSGTVSIGSFTNGSWATLVTGVPMQTLPIANASAGQGISTNLTPFNTTVPPSYTMTGTFAGTLGANAFLSNSGGTVSLMSASVPEPTSVVMAALGFAPIGLIATRRWRRA
jgi:hypothetical protein